MRGGLLLIAAALCLAGYNIHDSCRAAKSANKITRQLNEVIPSAISLEEKLIPAQQAQDTPKPAYVQNPEMEMPTAQVDGHSYIGELDIPSLKLSLPVSDEWSYPNLKRSPCRYLGSVYLDHMIIAAHNYESHFGRLKELNQGDEILFTDITGNVFHYHVSETDTLPPTAIEELESDEWDLTLFTCTIGGKARLAVRCTRQK